MGHPVSSVWILFVVGMGPESIFPPWFREILGTDDATRVANHWVPFTYMKRFIAHGVEEPLLWLYDRESARRPREVNPAVLARENLLYVVREAPIPDVVERLLAWIERGYGHLWRKLVCGPDVGGFYTGLNPDEKEHLGLYIAFQQTRTPMMRDISESIGALHATVHLRGRLLDVETARDDFELVGGERPSVEFVERLREDIESGDLTVGPNPAHWLVIALKIAPELAEIISDFPHRVIRAPEGVSFPTSDLPVVLVRRKRGDRRYEMGGGWLEEHVEATLTLSPSYVLLFSQEIDDPVITTRKWAESVVTRTVQHARRFVFASSRDTRYAQVLEESLPPDWVADIGGRQVGLTQSPTADILREIDRARASFVRFGVRQRR